ncbi:GNAT family N-acetyltransferase [Piscinibacter aquaticus]|uniref:GNAT family N-acetyltransferase n=1 Tax=Piscinibacter aquaticus TaxID=392597 RepID=A0A5C6U1Y5_9BURK|nr:GNAT family N-acetyltransferase [Piscinibacter aquaticus]
MFYGQPADPTTASAFVRDRLIQGDSVFLLARGQDGSALGFTQLYPTFSSIACRRAFVLNDLYIVEAARGQGVARALLDAARTHAMGAGAAYISLETAIDNTRAQALYESFGFERDVQFLTYALSLS